MYASVDSCTRQYGRSIAIDHSQIEEFQKCML